MGKTHGPKLPWMPLYVSDFDNDEKVQQMTLADEGAYNRLLRHHWREGSIPADPKAIAKILRCGTARAKRIMSGMVGKCFEIDPENESRMINFRAKMEQERTKKNREMGRVGGLKSAELNRLRKGGGRGGGRGGGTNHSESESESESENSSSRAEPFLATTSNGPEAVLPESRPEPKTEDATGITQRPQDRILGGGMGQHTNQPAESPLGASTAILDLSTLFHPVNSLRSARAKLDPHHAQLASKLIARIRLMEKSATAPFDAGAWWGKCRESDHVKLETLSLFAMLCENGRRPDSPWAYCNEAAKQKRMDRAATIAEERQKLLASQPAVRFVSRKEIP